MTDCQEQEVTMSQVFEQGHALIIGVGADLPNTVDDAEGLASILLDAGRCAYEPKRLRLLTEAEADRDSVLVALDELAHSTDANSTIIIYFSGHGYQVDSSLGQAYYLMPYGYNITQLAKTAISGAEFAEKLRAIPSQKQLVLLDCCHAGGVGNAKAPGLALTKAPLPPEAQTLLAQGRGQVLIASSQEDELSYAGKPYSAFTLALIEAFAGAGVAKQDGYVRVTDLALHAREMVPGRTNNKQHPILHFEQADNFVLGYYAGGDTQPKGVPFSEAPEIEPSPGAWRGINQAGQTIHGSQTNIAGDANAPVLSGTFHSPVEIGRQETVHVQGGFYQPNMQVRGSVYQATGDMLIGAERPAEALATLFADLLKRIEQLPAEDRDEVAKIAHGARVQAEKLQNGDESSATQSAFEKRLKTLKTMAGDIGDLVIATLANPAAGVAMVIQKIAKKVQEETSTAG
jgi:hypothetical protein